MSKFLVIQTAFIGDVVLATAVVEKLHSFYPNAQIDFLLRKGNEALLKGHPFINKVWIWDKKKQKQRNLLLMIRNIRKEGYDYVINLHRYSTSGLITVFSGAKEKIGFDKNPLSVGFTKKIKHIISEPYSANPVHEIDRNQMLIADITDSKAAFPVLYPSDEDYKMVKLWQTQPYICIAPSSVWFTKQFPVEKWASLLDEMPKEYKVFLLGGPEDAPIAEAIMQLTSNKTVESLCGKLSFLQSAALMRGARMNYVNDSGPLHFCSAVNAPVTAVFCSTVPAFGFGPVRENARIVEVSERLSCRPCGLHGLKACPLGHFNCAMLITNQQLLWWTSK